MGISRYYKGIDEKMSDVDFARNAEKINSNSFLNLFTMYQEIEDKVLKNNILLI